jgi:hypothetical protein
LLAWPAEDFGGGVAAFLLSKLARPIVRSTLWSLTPNKRADRRDEIRELLDLINEKICDNRSNEEVVEALGDHWFAMLDIFRDDNDANIYVDTSLRCSEADEYTPKAFDKFFIGQNQGPSPSIQLEDGNLHNLQ